MTLEDCYRWGKADVLKMHQQTQRSYRAVYQRTSTCSWWCAVICLFKDFFFAQRHEAEETAEHKPCLPSCTTGQGTQIPRATDGKPSIHILVCIPKSPTRGWLALKNTKRKKTKKQNLGQGGCLLAAALPKFRIAAPCTAAHNRGCGGGWPGAPFMRTSHTSCVYLSS